MARIVDLNKKWGDKSVFDGFSLEVADGSVTAIMGRSGVGKSTLLNCIADLTDYEGLIQGFGRTAYVFQEPRLIEFMSARQNVEYVLRGKFADKDAVNRLIDGVFALMKISGLADRAVRTLSGGERQRVNLARAFAYPSDSVLLDEPFNSLDTKLKLDLLIDLKTMITTYKKTCLMVTHSVDEALFMADSVVYVKDRSTAITVSGVSGDKNFGYESDGEPRKMLCKLLYEE
ncbi:MAG: ABC transporter ATP-binding protein [Clostridia bacterium]|nr:ABC transporter ATP-binding protein [Clostridia bacterium]